MGVIDLHFTADSAFLLEPVSHEEIIEILSKENIDTRIRPLIGISASQHIYDLELKNSNSNLENPYACLMVKVVDYLIEN